MRAYWERDEDISDRDVLASIATSAGFDGAALIDIADAKPARDELAALTETAEVRGVFGAPTFFVGDEMFWGKDRLDFVERCSSVQSNCRCVRPAPFSRFYFVRIREARVGFDASKRHQRHPTIRSRGLDTL